VTPSAVAVPLTCPMGAGGARPHQGHALSVLSWIGSIR
jgi:hypothetical protein